MKSTPELFEKSEGSLTNTENDQPEDLHYLHDCMTCKTARLHDLTKREGLKILKESLTRDCSLTVQAIAVRSL